MTAQILTLPTGGLQVNTYIIRNQGQAIVIDPGGDAPKIFQQLGKCALAAALLTHSHYDHLGAVNELLAKYPQAKFSCHDLCMRHASSPRANFSAEISGRDYAVRAENSPLNGGETVLIAGCQIKTFFVPGHTDDSVCFYFEQEKALFGGDTVFAGSIGRSDLPGGDGVQLVREIIKMLEQLPPETTIYPGHGESSTVAEELSGNPFLRG